MPQSFLSSEKFAHEFKLPGTPKELDSLLVQARVQVDGELKQRSGGPLKLQVKGQQIKAAVEAKIDGDLRATFGLKFDEKSLKPMADVLAKGGTKEEFFKALATPFEASLKNSVRWRGLVVTPEVGLELSVTPLVIRVSGEFEDDVLLDGTPFAMKCTVKLGFNVGLSKKGWAWVVQRVGPEAVKQFIARAGASLAAVGEWLVAEGILATAGILAAALVATAGLTALMAWLVDDAKRKGEVRGLATWYPSAYVNRVFGEPRPSGFITGNVRLRDELIVLGERDALTDARQVLRQMQHAAADASDARALEAYREVLLVQAQQKWDTAKIRLRQSLERRSLELAAQ